MSPAHQNIVLQDAVNRGAQSSLVGIFVNLGLSLTKCTAGLLGAVFDRYNIVSENDVVNAGRQLDEKFGHSLGTVCTKTVQGDSVVH
jgi:hypothetical protein